MKRFTALLLALVMMFALCACGGNNGGTVAGEVDASPLTKDDVISVIVPSHPSWPFDKEWKAIDYMEEVSGATLDIKGVPNSEWSTKLTLLFADPKSLPDVIMMTSPASVTSHANQGSLIPYSQVEQYMPNAKKFFDSLDENTYETKVTRCVSFDGELYFFNCAGRDRTMNLFSWMYRKDIFDKHGLKVPTTFDEIYEVSKELKKLYPDSYPFGIRALWEHGFKTSGPSWRK
ncbi:MAG: extracellular solute-binding protein, partial [Oscillospiraceae bacterium]|nr:extracellular solute-binding protein [Oscillospiraceae bacterium]